MSTTLTINADRSAMVDEHNPTTNYSSGTVENLKGIKALLVGFPDTQLQSYLYKDLEASVLKAYFTNNDPSIPATGYGHALLTPWIESTVTWETRPDSWSVFITREFYSAGYKDLYLYLTELRDILAYGVLLSGGYLTYGYSGDISIQTSRGAYPPQLVLTFSDEDAVPTVSGAPSGGYVNKHGPITLSWSSRVNASTLAQITQTDATVRWREGSSGTVHEIGSLGALTSYTLAADAVSGGELQWQVEVTYNSGAVVTSRWYVCSTVEALSTAEIVRPKDTLVDASQPVTLEWRHVISTGTAQTAADLQTSTDGTAWSQLAQISGAANTYVVAAGTWTGGTRYWRVRTYNTDAAAGAWSAAAQISVVGGPSQPVVACTSDPRPVVSWQAEGQQGFEAEIGGRSSGVVYGTAKSWQPQEFLPDGPATARVRVVNSYGLWSDWGEVGITVSDLLALTTLQPGLFLAATGSHKISALGALSTRSALIPCSPSTAYVITSGLPGTMRVGAFSAPPALNDSPLVFATATASDGPVSCSLTTSAASKFIFVQFFIDGDVSAYGATIEGALAGFAVAPSLDSGAFTVTAYAGNEVGLTWDASPGAGAYWIYRNGDKIAETEDLQYTDRWSNGENVYKVRAIIGSGYRDSADAPAAVAVRCPRISALDGEWLELRYSTEPVPTLQNVHSRPVSLLSVQGSVFPVAEVSPHRTRSWALQAAFPRGSGGAAALGALLGREVVFKDQYGHLVHGVMAAVTTSSSRFYDVCSAQLQEVEGVE